MKLFAVLFRTSIIAALMGLMFGAVAAEECPLCDAADKGDVVEVKRLLAAGADVNAEESKGKTALIEAASGFNRVAHRIEIVKLLLAAGADANAMDDSGMTALHYVVKGGNIEIIKLLLAAGANVSAKDNSGNLALHTAIGYGAILKAKLLLAAGADVNMLGGVNDKPALMYAATGKRTNLLKLLLEHGADINFADKQGNTALIIAAKRQADWTVKTLLDAGADPSIENNKGFTALDYARSARNIDMTDMLESAETKQLFINIILTLLLVMFGGSAVVMHRRKDIRDKVIGLLSTYYQSIKRRK